VKRYGKWIGYALFTAFVLASWWCEHGQFIYHHHSCWCTRDPNQVRAR